MAEVALTAIAKSALQLFTSLAKDEFLLQRKSRKELQRLKDTIETLNCFLQDVDRLQSKELSVQSCLSRIRNVMYEVDDFFDALAAEALHKNTKTGNVVQLLLPKSSFGFKIAHKVKGFREFIDRILADMVLCGFVKQPRPLGNQEVMRFDRNKTHSFVHEEDVIGRSQDRDRIIKMLLPRDEGESTYDAPSCFAIAIIGFGGLGKTTLAQFVYNDERVIQGFDVRLWACINDLSNLEQVFIEIIASEERRHTDLGLQKLQEKLREIIGGKKFLVVLDDVWDENSNNWRRLKNILRCGKIGSKVLVTSRYKKVAKYLDASKPYCVELGELSNESAWYLFVKKAFHKGEMNKYPELEPLGKKIVSSCKNVPLAIIIVGSLVRHRKREGSTWSHFLNDELGKALLNVDDDESIKNVLMVSYNDLPLHLKLCFAYCSLFPKEYRFDKDELVRSWLAQGFIKPSTDNECLEELGEECFFHLVGRCFFQEIKEYYYRDKSFSLDVDNCLYGHTAKMHDLLHDVAIYVAKSESIHFDNVLIKRGKGDNVRHISIDFDVDDSFDYLSLISDAKATRTLLFHKAFYSESSISMSMLASFRMLRTLNLQNRGIKKIPDSIGDLIHLRYLNLSNNKLLKNLPLSISKLHHLMIFELRGCKLLEKLPPKIEKMVSLRQLCIAGCDKLDYLPSGLISLTSLVVLDRLIVHHHSGGLGYLKGLDNLRGFLTIELPKEGWPSDIEDGKGSNMSKKHKVDGMVIDWKKKVSNIAQKMGKDEAKAVLETLKPPPGLEHLKIRNYGGKKLPGWFCMMKNVKELHLCGCEHVEYVEDEMRINLFLPSLQTLEIREMKKLRGWWRKDIPGEMQRPCLAKVSQLSIHDCPELKGQMPFFEGIEFLYLKSVDVNLVMELLPSVNPNCSSLTPFDRNNANRKLQELRLWSIKDLVCLPEGWIRNLTALKTLNIDCCFDLRLVSRRGLSYLTALKKLNLEGSNCEIGDRGDDEKMKKEVVGMPWKALPGLETLKLPIGDSHLHEGLQYLTSLTDLVIEKWKGIQMGDGEMGGVQLPSNALQNLNTLHIGFDDYKSIICHLPKAGIQYLHSLKRLKIGGCKELYLGWKTLLINMKLDWLELMRVGRVVDVEEMVVEQRSQLRVLDIDFTLEEKWVHDIPWKSLAKFLQHLYLKEIGEMEELPDGIQHLTSLRWLDISRCSKVRSVPEWIPHLTSLTWFRILSCSEELERRCERERGEDWPLIRHIPHISIRHDKYVPSSDSSSDE